MLRWMASITRAGWSESVGIPRDSEGKRVEKRVLFRLSSDHSVPILIHWHASRLTSTATTLWQTLPNNALDTDIESMLNTYRRPRTSCMDIDIVEATCRYLPMTTYVAPGPLPKAFLHVGKNNNLGIITVID